MAPLEFKNWWEHCFYFYFSNWDVISRISATFAVFTYIRNVIFVLHFCDKFSFFLGRYNFLDYKRGDNFVMDWSFVDSMTMKVDDLFILFIFFFWVGGLVFHLHSQFSYTFKSSLGSFIWHIIINFCFAIRAPHLPCSPFLRNAIRGELMLFALIRQYSLAGSGHEHPHSLTMITHVV